MACGLGGGTGIPTVGGASRRVRSEGLTLFHIVYSQKGKEVIVVSPWVSAQSSTYYELRLSTRGW